MKSLSEKKVIKDDECFKIIRKKLSQESMDHYDLISYEVIPLSAVNGYMGQYFTLRATVGCSQDTQSLTFFTKVPPCDSSPQHDFMQEMGSFKKEVDLYTIVFPEIMPNVSETKQQQQSKHAYVPQCFLGLEDEIIVLEDMAYSGFRMTNKFTPFDYEHSVVLMRTLGRFHAKSLVYETLEKRSLYDDFAHCMHETLWPLKGKRSTSMFDAAVKGLLALVDLIEDLNDEQKRILKGSIETLSRNHAKNLLPSRRFKNVLCHGDLWANNILYKYDDAGKPTACCLIDFQLARYNPPAHDILCFLQFSTNRTFRQEHLADLLDVYYGSLSSSLAERSLEAGDIFPRSELDDSVEELGLMCKMHGALNIPIMLLEAATVSKYFVDEPQQLERVLYVDRTPLVTMQFEESPLYRERMCDALLELYGELHGRSSEGKDQ
ncbi:hypothetical protein TKK_0017207 [Trichogramma kaykai]|uniref:CHK kinase-like domain-containing protein n=1 Tax=Trichogramma kaykai TaxID=54128 RepID=A0ABD2W6B2_9HYME